MVINIYSDNVAPYRIQWAEELAKAGNDVTFAYTKAKDIERNDNWLVEESNSVKLQKLPARIIKNHAITFNVIRHIKKNQPDIIIFDGYGVIPNFLAILYMNAKHRPYYINFDGITMKQTDNKLRKFLKKPAFSRYANFFCGSELTKRYIISMGVDADKVTVHNFSSIHEKDIIPAPLTKAEKSEMRRKLGLEDRPTVIAVGRFIKLKRFELLIEIFAGKHYDYNLLIIGEGELREKYEKIIGQYALTNVKIINFMPYNLLVDYYKASDLHAFPSESETWGLVVNEAMCFGLPCITTKYCVAGEAMIKNGVNGFVVDESIEALAEKIDCIMENEELRGSMAVEALKTAHNYTIENMAEVHLEKLNYMYNQGGFAGDRENS